MLSQISYFTQSNNEDEETKINFRSLSLYTLPSLCSLCETSRLLREPPLTLFWLYSCNNKTSCTTYFK